MPRRQRSHDGTHLGPARPARVEDERLRVQRLSLERDVFVQQGVGLGDAGGDALSGRASAASDCASENERCENEQCENEQCESER